MEARYRLSTGAKSGYNTTMSHLPKTVQVIEVGPRDGLQNEAVSLTVGDRIELIRLLADAGLREIEVGAFVRPDRVPQMTHTAEVVHGLPQEDGVTYSTLVPNQRGLDAAIDCGVKSIAVFTAASETFAQRNIGMSIEDSLSLYAELVPKAKLAQMKVRVYLSTAYYCPFEGRVPPTTVAGIASQIAALGIDELSIGDTVGWATPGEVKQLHSLLAGSIPMESLAYHFHDTRGMALANTLEALNLGATRFDSSIGGAGGCPFAPGASGNLATEDLVYMLSGMGIETGVSLEKLRLARTFIEAKLGRSLPGRAFN